MSDTATTSPHDQVKAISGTAIRTPLLLAGLLATSVGACLVAPSSVRTAGAVAVGALTVAAALPSTRGRRLSRHTTVLLLAAAITAVSIADGGLVPGTDDSPLLPLLCLAAYPPMGIGLLRHVARFRLLRRSDLVVEATLIGAAAAVVLQAGVDWRTAEDASQLLSRSGALTLLVGLDVALLIVVSWSLRIQSARNGALGLITSGLTALTAAHVIAATLLAGGEAPGTSARLLVGLGILAIGAGAVHMLVVSTDKVTAVEPALFSAGHATVVVVALLAAPTVLLVQTVRGASVSATVAVGTALSGLILANYVVELLRERASSEHKATHDPLTLLPNRVLFMDRLERAIAHAERNDAPVGVLFLDLDGFKDVNDTLGHEAGDQLLRTTAARLLDSARHEDTVARLAGDEFAVLLPHLQDADDAVLVSERILTALSELAPVAGHQVRNPASIGVATFPADGTDPLDLVAAADSAMYVAKETPGASMSLASGHSTLHAERLETETALHEAIHEGQLRLHYQPIVDASTQRIAGAEALVRWQHPEKGLLSPFHFVPVAEKSDLIVLLGEWVLRAACEEQARWASLGYGDRYVSVNVSTRQFDERLVSTVASALRTTGANPARIVLEVTESAAVDDLELVAERLRELRSLGVTAAVDDFGTGYCSLQYLGDLPVSTLKIDKSFVQAMTPRSAAIVAATIAMGQSLGMRIVAEGVETDEQQRFLTHHGCDLLQGYHLGRPMPADEFVDMLRQEPVPAPPAGPTPTATPTCSVPEPAPRTEADDPVAPAVSDLPAEPASSRR